MALEAVAAALVGVVLLWLVLEPLVRPRPPAPPIDEPLDSEETAKGVALAALKEIEFDRETGKLSDADYEALKAKYTAVALEALRQEEADVAAGDVEALIAARVDRLRSARAPTSPDAPVCPTCGPRPEPDAVFCSSCGTALPTAAVCGRCHTPVAPGGRFCERCGAQVAA